MSIVVVKLVNVLACGQFTNKIILAVVHSKQKQNTKKKKKNIDQHFALNLLKEFCN